MKLTYIFTHKFNETNAQTFPQFDQCLFSGKFIQNKLLTSFLALLLIIKLIKLKFMFVIPFLFGVGTAKKLFLKLLLFFIPAFAHVFKLCSSYYSTHGTKYHHHHHQVIIKSISMSSGEYISNNGHINIPFLFLDSSSSSPCPGSGTGSNLLQPPSSQ